MTSNAPVLLFLRRRFPGWFVSVTSHQQILCDVITTPRDVIARDVIREPSCDLTSNTDLWRVKTCLIYLGL